MAQRILVVGSANMDLVFRGDRLPAPGETRMGTEFDMAPGGKGANQAVAVGRLGASVAFVGCVGEDANGEILRKSLLGAGVNLEMLTTTRKAPTGVAGIMVGGNAQNSIMVVPGANGLVTAAHVSEAIDRLTPTVILAQLEVPLEAVMACAGKGLFILNPAPARPLPSEFLSQVDVITPNESEAEALTGVIVTDNASRKAACRRLHASGVKAVILTLGAEGVYVSTEKTELLIPPPAVSPVDTTAAGDAFNGALAFFLAESLSLQEAAQQACRYAALSTTKPGAQSAMPTLAEWESLS